MKHILLAMLLPLGLSAICGAPNGWQLAWHDDFDSTQLDTAVWSRCERRKSDWNLYMSNRPDLVEVRDGNLVLSGVVNNDPQADSAAYLTGGVCTKNKKSFAPGRMEVRARFTSAQGAWPAIWMLPFDTRIKWPDGGELDLMERLNYDASVHQTVHSYFTYTLGIKQPPSTRQTPINPDEYNVYAVEVDSAKVTFFVNDVPTLVYPRINGGALGQFPYTNPMYLILDMQLGGNWAGRVNESTLPARMFVDWVRYYERPSRFR